MSDDINELLRDISPPDDDWLIGFRAESIIVDDPCTDTIDPAAIVDLYRSMPGIPLLRAAIPTGFYDDIKSRRRSIIAAMHSARRARARKRKPITADDASVHGAISAMQRGRGRAHEL